MASLPCTPSFSRVLLGVFTQQRSTFCFSSFELLQAKGGCSLLPWSCLGSFMSDWGLGPHSLAVFFSLFHFLPLDCSDGTAWSSLRWKPKQEREQEMTFLGSLPSFVTAPRGRLPARATQESCLDTWVRFFPSPWSLGLSLTQASVCALQMFHIEIFSRCSAQNALGTCA